MRSILNYLNEGKVKNTIINSLSAAALANLNARGVNAVLGRQAIDPAVASLNTGTTFGILSATGVTKGNALDTFTKWKNKKLNPALAAKN